MQLSDAGSYQCLVSNTGGNTNPPAARLTVLPIPTTASQVGLTNSLVLHLPFDADYKTSRAATTTAPQSARPPCPGQPRHRRGRYLHYSSDSTPSYNYVTLGKPSDLQFGNNVDFSVAFWVRQAYANIGTNLPFFGHTVGSIGATLGSALPQG